MTAPASTLERPAPISCGGCKGPNGEAVLLEASASKIHQSYGELDAWTWKHATGNCEWLAQRPARPNTYAKE
jgi:hypothetical protein